MDAFQEMNKGPLRRYVTTSGLTISSMTQTHTLVTYSLGCVGEIVAYSRCIADGHKILRYIIETTSYFKIHPVMPRRTINQCRGIVTPVNAQEPPKPISNAAKDSIRVPISKQYSAHKKQRLDQGPLPKTAMEACVCVPIYSTERVARTTLQK